MVAAHAVDVKTVKTESKSQKLAIHFRIFFSLKIVVGCFAGQHLL
jgi:hypothetical protein